MKRWVLDTNILVSALLWNGSPRLLFEQGFSDGVQFITSPALLAELQATLAHPKLRTAQRARGLDHHALFDAARVILRSVDSPPLPQAVSRDPDDDAVLACAAAAGAQADCLG